MLGQESDPALVLRINDFDKTGKVLSNRYIWLVSILMLAQKDGKQLEISVGYALLCTGRKPLLNTEELDRLSIEYTKAGIKIDKNMMTNVAGIYAVGDVTGGMMLAHRAMQQAKMLPAISVKIGLLFITKTLFLQLYIAIRRSRA